MMDILSMKILLYIINFIYFYLPGITCITNAKLIAYTNKIPRFDFNNHNISQAVNLTAAEVKCNNFVATQALQNPGFELGLYGWDISNEASTVFLQIVEVENMKYQIAGSNM